MKLEFHHINFVSEDVDRLHDFYTQVLGLDDIPIQSFPRPDATGSSVSGIRPVCQSATA